MKKRRDREGGGREIEREREGKGEREIAHKHAFVRESYNSESVAVEIFSAV